MCRTPDPFQRTLSIDNVVYGTRQFQMVSGCELCLKFKCVDGEGYKSGRGHAAKA